MADPPIIDGSVLERQKENIVPSRDGRSALAISQVYSMPRAQRDKELAATHTRFREQIEATKDNEDFEDDEALDLYCQYVGWIMDNYPSGSSTESGLLGVLEDATRRFAQEPIYKNDRRYIRLWMEYANLIEQSDRVYAFMLANEIGWAWPHVYEEYALILERNGNLSKADQIYRLAINRRVSGLTSLKAHYKEFQARCASRPSGVDEDPVPPPVQATSRPPLGGRSVLGTINPQRSRQPAPQSLVPRTPAAPPSRSNAGKIAVFVDGGDSQEDAQLNEWSTLQTRGEAIKENTASKVDGALHQRPFVPRTPKVMIHRDEPTTPAAPATPHVPGSTLRPQAPSGRSEVVKDPLRKFGSEFKFDLDLGAMDQSQNSTTIPATDASLPPTSKKPQNAPSLSSSTSRPLTTVSSNVSQPGSSEQPASTSTSTSTSMPQAPASGAPRILPNGLKSLVGPKPKPEFMVKEGKRPEVGAFDLEIVWHNDEEYHRWEYWAKQEGLLGKVWDPPPTEEDDSVPLKDGSGAGARKSMRNRRSTNVRFAGGSPTTNTKAALDDVFGMFNETVMVDDLLQDGDDDDDNETPASRPPVPSTPAPLIALGGSIKSASFTPLVSQPTKPTALATTTPRFEVARDENAPAPKSVAKTPAPKFAVFQESKTPGPSTTPGLAPKFSVFSDSRAENAAITPGVRLGSSVVRDPDPARATAVFGGPSKTPTAKFSVFQEDGQEQIPVTPGMGLRTSAAPLALKPASTTSTVSSPPEEDSFDDDGPIDNIPSSPAGVLSLTASTKPKDPKTNPGPPQTTPLSYRDSPSASGLRASDSRQRLESPRGGDVFTDDVAEVEEEESPAHESEATADNQEDGDAQDEIDEVSENEENDPYDYIPPREYEIRGGVAIMTPITERTLEYETSKSIRISQGSSRDSISHVLDGLNSSPYGPGKHSSGRPSLTTNFRRRSSIRPRPSTIREHSEEHEGGDEADAGISGATPVNPFLPEMIEGMIDAVWSNLDLSRYRDFSDRESQYLERFESHSRKLARSQLSKSQQDSPAPLAFTLGEEEYNLIEKIGEGGFGAVFLAEDQSIKDLLADDPETTQEGSELVAIKVVRPSMLWEYAVLHVLRSSLPPGPILSSIISPHAFYHFSNESHLLMEYSNQGTLLDAVNNASKIGISTQDTHGIDELLIMFFAIELIKIIKCLHGEHFIHGDLKIDNCLLRLADPVEIPLDTIYDPEGEGGWSERGVKLIDFGRTIDAGLFDPEQTFIGNWPTDARDCVEMREGRPWTYQTDYAGLAGIVYCMMFGKYIETVAGPTTAKGRPRYKLATPLKRYWQTELWSRLFDVLLNPTLAREDGTLPLVDELAAIEDTMANWLAANCEKKGKSLKKMLGQMYQFSKNRRSTSGRK